MMSHQLFFGSFLVIFALKAASAVNIQLFVSQKTTFTIDPFSLSPIQVSIREITNVPTEEDIAEMITNGISIEDGIAMGNSITEEEFIEMLPPGMSEEEAVASMVANLSQEELANAVASMSIEDARAISNCNTDFLIHGLTEEEMNALPESEIATMLIPEMDEEDAIRTVFGRWGSKENSIAHLYYFLCMKSQGDYVNFSQGQAGLEA
jgi:hypothetical protein